MEHEQFYILMRQGNVLRLPMVMEGGQAEARNLKIWPYFQSHEDADRFIKHIEANDDDVKPALIGATEGETLDSHIDLALTEGCDGSCSPTGWNEDGSPVWSFSMFQ